MMMHWSQKSAAVPVVPNNPARFADFPETKFEKPSLRDNFVCKAKAPHCRFILVRIILPVQGLQPEQRYPTARRNFFFWMHLENANAGHSLPQF